MVKDHSDNEIENPLPPHGLLFPINSKGYFICPIQSCYTSRGALAGTRRESPLTTIVMKTNSAFCFLDSSWLLAKHFHSYLRYIFKMIDVTFDSHSLRFHDHRREIRHGH